MAASKEFDEKGWGRLTTAFMINILAQLFNF